MDGQFTPRQTIQFGEGVLAPEFRHVAGGDTTAPTLTNPVDAAASDTTGSGSVDTNEGNGTLYWVVTQSGTSPSAAQVKAGQDHTGAAADDSGSQAVSGTGTQTITGGFTGLTAETAYFAHYMHEDAASNQSAVSSGDGFTTQAASAVIIQEVGGVGGAVLNGTAPNTVNTPGNLWTSGSDATSALRNNGRIEANTGNDRNAIDAEVTDMKVSATFNPNSGVAGVDEIRLYARSDAAIAVGGGNGFFVLVSPNRLAAARLFRSDSAVNTVLDTDNTDLNNTDAITVEITANGTAISAVVTQGATVINLSAVDAGHATLTQAGLFLGSSTVFLDDFIVETV